MKHIPDSIIARKEEFLSHVKVLESGCWEWQLGKHPTGYGRFLKYSSHRVSYAIHNGDPFGKLVCHRCDFRACVRPDHLFLGTHKDNTRDMMEKGRDYKYKPFERNSVITEEFFNQLKLQYETTNIPLARLAKQHGIDQPHLRRTFALHGVRVRRDGPKLGEAEVTELRRLCSSGKTYRELAEIFGITPVSVKRIYLGYTWGDFKTPYDPTPKVHVIKATKALVEEIKILRLKGFLLKDIAIKFGLDDSYLSKLCSGKQTPKF